MKQLSFLILMPVSKFIGDMSFISLVHTLSNLHGAGHKYEAGFCTCANIGYARNRIVAHANKRIEEGKVFDYILWLDSDHHYDPQVIFKLVKDLEDNPDLPMISAAYTCRTAEQNGTLNYAMLKKNDQGVIAKIRANDPEHKLTGIVDCDVIGFGCVLMRPEFIVEFSKKHKPLFKMSDEVSSGEDVYFCGLMKQDGYRVCFDADAIIGHYGTVNFII